MMMRKTRSSAIFVALWSVVALLPPSPAIWAEGAPYAQHLRQGKEFYASGDYEAAIKELRQAVASEPKMPEAHFILGVIYARMGKNDLARESFVRVIELEPDNVQAHNNLGVIYETMGLFDLAQEELRKAVKIDPQYEQAHFNLARLYLGMAARQYEELLRSQPDNPEVGEAYRKVLELDPQNARARYSLARLLLKEGKEAEALDAFRAAWKLEPAYGPLRIFHEGRTKEREGNYEEALHEYRLALKLKPDYFEARYHLGLVYSFLGRHAEAAGELEQVVGQEGVDPAESHHYLGYSYFHLGRLDEAILHLGQALERKETPQSRWVLGQSYEKKEDFPAALREYQAVARLDPGNEPARVRLEALKAREPAVVAQPVPSPPLPPETAPVSSPATRPDFLINAEGARPGHVLVVEKVTQKLFLYRCADGLCRTAKTFPCSTGQKDGDKARAGDLRTPEGVYFFTEVLEGRNLPLRYGVRAFPMDYPNHIDRMQGKDGNGIWLHGTDKPKLPRTDTQGCVVVSNRDLMELSRFIRLRETPIVIVDRLSLVPPEGLQAESQEIKELIDAWKKAWEEKRLDDYLSFYSENFLSQNMDRQGWREYKEKINQKVQEIQVTLSDLKVFRHKDFLVCAFRQVYRSDQHSDRGMKRLYLRNEGGQWKIWGEEWAGL